MLDSLWAGVKSTASVVLESADDFFDSAEQAAQEVGQVLKEGVSEAGRLAQKTRLQTDVAMLEQQVAAAKRRWGGESFDAMTTGDMATVYESHAKIKAEIDQLMAEIAAAEREISALDELAVVPPEAPATAGPLTLGEEDVVPVAALAPPPPARVATCRLELAAASSTTVQVSIIAAPAGRPADPWPGGVAVPVAD